MLQRTLSLTRGDKPGGGLLRRLSGRGPPPTRDFNLGGKTNSAARRMSMDGPFPPATADESTRPGIFRRPTNLSRSASKKSTKSSTKSAVAAAAAGDDDMINLEGGLAITLNLELNCKDPSGITTPYKLLVPMLRGDGAEYDPPATQVTKGWRKWLGVRRKQKEEGASTDNASQNPDAENGGVYNDHDDDEDEESDEEDYPEHRNWNQHRDGEEDDEEDDSEESDQESPELSKKKEKGTSKRRKWFGFG